MADPYQFPPPEESQRSSAKTGMLLISAVFGCIVVMIALLIAYTFGLERPTQARISNATSTAIADAAYRRQQGFATSTAAAEATVIYWQEFSTVPEDWVILFRDDFYNGSNWYMGRASSDLADSEKFIKDETLSWVLDDVKGVFWHDIPEILGSADVATDFLVSVEAKQSEGNSQYGNYGILFRYYQESHYVFEVNQSGAYCVLLYDDGWETLIPWTKIDFLHEDGLNKLTVRGEGSHFTFFINDNYVDQLDDDRVKKGRIGLAVEGYESPDPIGFVFDNMVISVPPTSDALTARAAPTPIRSANEGRPFGLPLGWQQYSGRGFDATKDPDWLTLEHQLGSGAAERTFTNGVYAWSLMPEGEALFYTEAAAPSRTAPDKMGDSYLTVEMQQVSGTPDDALFGLFFRAEGDKRYIFEISDAGMWDLVFADGLERTYLLEPTHKPGMRPGEVRRLAILIERQHLTCFINNQEVAEIDIDAPNHGYWGISVWVPDGANPIEIQFDKMLAFIRG